MISNNSLFFLRAEMSVISSFLCIIRAFKIIYLLDFIKF